MERLQHIPEHALTIDFAMAGQDPAFQDGLVHRKTIQCTTIAQAVKGWYEVEVGGHTSISEPGGAFLASPGEWITITHHAPAADVRKRRPNPVMWSRWLNVRFLLYGAIDVGTLLTLPRMIPKSTATPFGEIIHELLDHEPRTHAFHALAQRNELLFQALTLLCDVAHESPTGELFLAGIERLTPVLAFARAHLAEALSIEDLSHAARLSPSHLHTLFRQHLQMTPLAYVKKLRIEQASRRLLLSDQPIKIVAEQTGFANPYHFSRVFKAATGLSPRDYRRQNPGMGV